MASDCPRNGVLWLTPGLTLFPLSTPAGLVQPLVLSTPADTIGPALTGHPRVRSFLLSAILPFQAMSETRAFADLFALSLSTFALCHPVSKYRIRVLKHQPEWFIHPGSSVSQEHRSLITPLPCARNNPSSSNQGPVSSALPPCAPESQQLACACRPLKFLPMLVLSLPGRSFPASLQFFRFIAVLSI